MKETILQKIEEIKKKLSGRLMPAHRSKLKGKLEAYEEILELIDQEELDAILDTITLK